MKEGANGKTLMIPFGVPKSLFRVSNHYWAGSSALVFLALEEKFNIIFSGFCLHPGCRKDLDDKIYPAMDPPVHGESDGVSFIS